MNQMNTHICDHNFSCVLRASGTSLRIVTGRPQPEVTSMRKGKTKRIIFKPLVSGATAKKNVPWKATPRDKLPPTVT
jgi:hypothetical protein